MSDQIEMLRLFAKLSAKRVDVFSVEGRPAAEVAHHALRAAAHFARLAEAIEAESRPRLRVVPDER